MRRPAVLIVGAVAGALLVAGVGASAHTGLFVTKSGAVLSGVQGDEASSPRTEPAETAEPTETPEAQPTAEPTETPEVDNEANDDAQGDENGEGAAAAGSGDHETGDHSGSGSAGGGGHDD